MGPRGGSIAIVVMTLAGSAAAQPSGPQDPQPQPYPSPQPSQQPQPQPYPSPQPPPAPQPPPPPSPANREPDNLICFAGRPYSCASTLLLEIGGRAAHDHSATMGAFGLVVHNGLDAFGATIGAVGFSDGAEDVNVLVAGRYRRYFGRWGFAGDVSFGYAGGPTVELAFGWLDIIAVTAGVNRYERDVGGLDTVASVGVRVGSVAIGGLFYAIVMAGTASR